jgi:hypothetical protein
VLLLLVGLAVAVPILWTLSVGAVREARAGRAADPARGCRAWTAVRGLPGRLYRCGEPVYAGGTRCLPHERGGDDAASHPDAERVEAPRWAAEARVRARIGVPLAVLLLVALVSVAAWLLVRAG